jgi:flagellar biosynthesis protein FlhF
MKIKKYLVKNLEDAISQIKKHLGKDAYILTQKKVSKRGKINQGNGEMIEVTAAMDMDKTDPGDISSVLLGKAYGYASPKEAQQRKEEIFGKLTPRAEPPLTQEAAEIKKLLRATADFDGNQQFKGIFSDLYLDLVESEVERELAEKLIHTLQYQTDADTINDTHLVKKRLFDLLTSSISLPSPLKPEKGKRKIVVMVGPTGCGKTTTIAKLASYFRLMESKRIALVTIDSYSIGAETHLKTYADILDVPFYSVYNEREMHLRLDRLKEEELIFVDTTGRSPNDKKGLLIMEKHLSGIPPKEKEVYLILSALTKTADLYISYDRFAVFQPNKFIFSKIDESLCLGNLFNLKMRTDIPAAYFTTGQRVPEDIEIAYPLKFARRVFGDYNNDNEKGETYEYE